MRADAKAGQGIKAVPSTRPLATRLRRPGMSGAYLSRIEAGERTPSLLALIELADRLETSALYLATGKTADAALSIR